MRLKTRLLFKIGLIYAILQIRRFIIDYFIEIDSSRWYSSGNQGSMQNLAGIDIPCLYTIEEQVPEGLRPIQGLLIVFAIVDQCQSGHTAAFRSWSDVDPS